MFLGIMNAKMEGKEVDGVSERTGVRTPGSRLGKKDSEASRGQIDWGKFHTGSKGFLFLRTESGCQCT